MYSIGMHRTYLHQVDLISVVRTPVRTWRPFMDKLLLTPVEAARALGIGRSKVYELLSSGELDSVRIGSCRRVPAEALHSFLVDLRRGARNTRR